MNYKLLLYVFACSTLHVCLNASELLALHDQLEILGNLPTPVIPPKLSKATDKSLGTWIKYDHKITGPIIFHPHIPNKLLCYSSIQFYNLEIETNRITKESQAFRAGVDIRYVANIHSEFSLKNHVYIVTAERTQLKNQLTRYISQYITSKAYDFTEEDLTASGIKLDTIQFNNTPNQPRKLEITEAAEKTILSNLRNKSKILKWFLRMALHDAGEIFLTVSYNNPQITLEELQQEQAQAWSQDYYNIAARTYRILTEEDEDNEMISCERAGLITFRDSVHPIYLVNYYKNDKTTTHTRLVGKDVNPMQDQDFGPTKALALSIGTKNISVVAVDYKGTVTLYTLSLNTKAHEWDASKALGSVAFDWEQDNIYIAIAGDRSKCAVVNHKHTYNTDAYELYISDLTQKNPQLKKINIDPAEISGLREIKMNVDGSMIGCIKREDTKASEDEGSDSVWAYDYLRVLKLNPSATPQS